MDTLGKVIKDARLQAGMTRIELAEKLQITPRHLMSIENGKQKPGYNLLYRVIRKLSIPADLIFYPEAVHSHAERERAISMLRLCGDKEIEIINAALQSMLKDKEDFN